MFYGMEHIAGTVAGAAERVEKAGLAGLEHHELLGDFYRFLAQLYGLLIIAKRIADEPRILIAGDGIIVLGVFATVLVVGSLEGGAALLDDSMILDGDRFDFLLGHRLPLIVGLGQPIHSNQDVRVLSGSVDGRLEELTLLRGVALLVEVAGKEIVHPRYQSVGAKPR